MCEEDQVRRMTEARSSNVWEGEMRPTRCVVVVKKMAGVGTAASVMGVPHIGSAAFAEASRRDGEVSWRSTHGPHAASP
jgi:hypothetical protein